MKKLIKDPIHGTIEIDEYLLKFIDTPQFQRLRNLYQLGDLYWVFPGATHRRFEHCIGASYLSEQLCSILQNNQPSLKITNHDKILIGLAGLCYNLGHGPFGRAWSDKLVPLFNPYTKKSWDHEDMSSSMLNYLITENDIAISDDDLNFVQSVINPKFYIKPPKYLNKLFLYDIISNHRNGIDVDKVDNVIRDCYYIGMKSSFNDGNLIKLCRVVNNEICFPQKKIYQIYELFRMQYKLFTEVYSYKTASAIDYMICDVLYNANNVYHFSDIIQNNDPEAFMKLTDNILYEIECSKNPLLKISQDIIQRIHNRDLYKYVGQCLISSINNNVHTTMYQLNQFTAENIAHYCTGNIIPDDLIVEKVKINYDIKDDTDPMLNTKFFPTRNINIVQTPNAISFCDILPTNFEKVYMRVFVKNSNKLLDALRGYELFLKKNGLR